MLKWSAHQREDCQPMNTVYEWKYLKVTLRPYSVEYGIFKLIICVKGLGSSIIWAFVIFRCNKVTGLLTTKISLLLQRTERAPKDRNIAEVDPPKFAQLLIDKLERVLKEQEKAERVQQSLNKVMNQVCMTPPPHSFQAGSKGLATPMDILHLYYSEGKCWNVASIIHMMTI